MDTVDTCHAATQITLLSLSLFLTHSLRLCLYLDLHDMAHPLTIPFP